VSKTSKGRTCWCKGLKMSRLSNLKNMRSHLKYDVTVEWLDGFEDIEKLKYLNHSLTRKRDCEGFTTEIYKQFIVKFYNDKKFNELYNKWLATGDVWIKPSLDHIKSKCNGGSLLVDNIRFISWFENRAKCNIPIDIWESMKERIYEYF